MRLLSYFLISSKDICLRIRSSFILLLVFSVGAIGQENFLHFHHLGSEPRLSSPEYNYFIHQDKIKRIWISSITGLNEFDGRRVTINIADKENPDALISPRASFSDIFESPEGTLWFTNVDAIISYEPKKDCFQRHFIIDAAGDTIPPEYMWMYLDTVTGSCFTYANDGIYEHNLYQSGIARKILNIHFNYNTITRKTSDSTYQFIRHRSNNFFIEFYSFNIQTASAKLLETQYTPDKSTVNFTFLLNKNRLLVATKDSLWQLLPGSNPKWIPNKVFFANKKISDIIDIERLDNGQLLLATRTDGLYIYDINKQKVLSKIFHYEYGSVRPFEEHITRTYLDKQNNIWISTPSNGVWYANFKKIKFRPIFLQKDAGSSQIISIAEGRNKEVLILAPTQLFAISNQDTLVYDIPLKGDGVEKPTFVYQDSQRNIWVGSLTKLFLKKQGQQNFIPIDISPSQNGEEIGFNSLYEIKEGVLVFAANQYSSILRANDSSKWITPTVKRPFFAKPIHKFLFSATHNRELYIHKLENLTSPPDTVLFLSGIATDIIPYRTPQVYYIPTFSGLYKLTYRIDSWKLNRDDHFPQLAINSIHGDENGYLWLASSQGLFRYHPENHAVWQFRESDGIQSPNFNFKSVLHHSDGRLFLGGNKGLNVFEPEKISPSVPQPSPAIMEILVNGQEGVLSKYSRSGSPNPQLVTHLRLPFSENNLRLFLSSLEYSDPEACQYKYRLLGAGRDTNWVDHGNNNVLDFPSLSAGKFTLEFNASNSDGIWALSPNRLGIHVNPPWYFSSWFLTIIGMGLLLLGFFIARRENRREREKEELRRKEAEAREQEETAKRFAAETQTALLRLQMDPHFIYNALNGVDDMIRQGKNSAASNYLYRISNLMRRILEQCEEQTISIREEMELLEHYLSAEQIRFGSRLSYHFSVDEAIDKDSIEIPTMILQPFVENAIWHGIAPKRIGGIVTIKFSFAQNALKVEVLDNGVGRSKAPKHLKKKYESKAINITQRRFDLIKESSGDSNAGFEIVDLFNTDNIPAGTKVIFNFPDRSLA